MQEDQVAVTTTRGLHSGNNSSNSASLEARMRRVRERAEGHYTEIFGVPGWDEVLAVELKVVGVERQGAIEQKHERVRQLGLRATYVAADKIIVATERFYEVLDNGEQRPLDDTETWISMARRGVPERVSDQTTERQALLAMLGGTLPGTEGTKLMRLYNDWLAWMSGERERFEDEVVAPFGTTGSSA